MNKQLTRIRNLFTITMFIFLYTTGVTSFGYAIHRAFYGCFTEAFIAVITSIMTLTFAVVALSETDI